VAAEAVWDPHVLEAPPFRAPPLANEVAAEEATVSADGVNLVEVLVVVDLGDLVDPVDPTESAKTVETALSDRWVRAEGLPLKEPVWEILADPLTLRFPLELP